MVLAAVLLAQSAMAHMSLLYPPARGSIVDRKQFDSEAHAFINYNDKRTLPCNGYNKVGPITKLRAGQIVYVSWCTEQLLDCSVEWVSVVESAIANMDLVIFSLHLLLVWTDAVLGPCAEEQLQQPSATNAQQQGQADEPSAPRWRVLPVLAELRRRQDVPSDWRVQKVVSGFLLRVASQDP